MKKTYHKLNVLVIIRTELTVARLCAADHVYAVNLGTERQ